MPCYSPLDGYRSSVVNASGKRSVTFDIHEGFVDRKVTVPCGQCIGCRLEKSRQWAMRCMHEASLYDDNCFITLTYDDESLPSRGSLDRAAYPKFMKRLRKRFSHERIRYYHCGEYGDQFGRPHYHSLLFGFDFPDKVPWTMRGDHRVWRSPELERLWPHGASEVGAVSFESAAYVARYVTKKVTGEPAAKHYDGREPEYATMSRRPGIGRAWYEQFRCEVYASDSVVVRGKEMKPPRYYDGMHELANPEEMASVKAARRKAQDIDEQRSSRLLVRRTVAEAGLLNSTRSV